MMRKFIKFFASSLLLGATVSLSIAVAQAQTYPDRPIRLVVSYPPGGATDIIGRLVAEVLGNRLRRRIIVENRGGGLT
jgi:tripartite-type tricarboxylate transporter receptor subunit TctC